MTFVVDCKQGRCFWEDDRALEVWRQGFASA